MLTDLELMNIHVSALFTHDAESRLLFVNEPDSAVAPASRLFLGRTRAGNITKRKTFDQLFVISHDDTFEEYVDNVVSITGSADGSSAMSA
jgi:hypothetical protein